MAGVSGEEAVVAREVTSRVRHERRQPREEIDISAALYMTHGQADGATAGHAQARPVGPNPRTWTRPEALLCVQHRTDSRAALPYRDVSRRSALQARLLVIGRVRHIIRTHHMNIPIETKPALWGALGGAVALAIVGFSWGGWMTAGKAETAASMLVDTAVVEALTPVCVAKFRRDAAVDANLAALKDLSSWKQGEFIAKGGWATVADSTATSHLSSVARACGEVLTKA